MSAAHWHFARALTRARKRTTTHAVACALDLAAPMPGHSFVSVCCWCLEKLDALNNELSPCVRMPQGGDCQRCHVSGHDVVMALVSRTTIAVADTIAELERSGRTWEVVGCVVSDLREQLREQADGR